MLQEVDSGSCGRAAESAVDRLFHAYLPHICEELGLPGAGSPAAVAAAKAVIQRMSKKKCVFGSSSRWLAALDAGKHLLNKSPRPYVHPRLSDHAAERHTLPASG